METNSASRTWAAASLMPLRYEVAFLLAAPQGHLVEVRRLDQPVGSPKSRVYHWLWVEANAVSTLQFVSMSATPRQQRTFEEAVLWFNDSQGESQWKRGDVVPLTPRAIEDLPRGLHGLIEQHLS